MGPPGRPSIDHRARPAVLLPPCRRAAASAKLNRAPRGRGAIDASRSYAAGGGEWRGNNPCVRIRGVILRFDTKPVKLLASEEGAGQGCRVVGEGASGRE